MGEGAHTLRLVQQVAVRDQKGTGMLLEHGGVGGALRKFREQQSAECMVGTALWTQQGLEITRNHKPQTAMFS